MVAVAWQGMLRRLVAGEHVERSAPTGRALLRRADLVGLSHLDVAPETTIEELTAHLHPGARLLVTQGGKGGLLVSTSAGGPPEVLNYLPAATDREVDPTGAGDTFLAALLATLVRPSVMGPGGGPLARGLRFAAAAGSLAVEGVGLHGVPDRRAVLRRRARERVRRAVQPSLSARVGVEDPASRRCQVAGAAPLEDRTSRSTGRRIVVAPAGSSAASPGPRIARADCSTAHRPIVSVRWPIVVSGGST